MKSTIWFLCILLTACGGSLTDEQRKKLKEGMRLNEIRKISDAQITEAAFALGRSLAAAIERPSSNASFIIDSLQKSCKIRIRVLQSGDSMLLAIEKQIVEAYAAGSGQVHLDDNIQRLGADSLLYTKPVMKVLPDGSEQFQYALGICLPRKQVVLSIKD